MSNRFAAHALVTGANRGLGLGWVHQLTGRVDRLFATCRRPEEATQLQEHAAAHSGTVDVSQLDVADESSIERVADDIGQKVDTLDLLVNNAGISGGGGSDRFGTVDQETMMQVLRVNTVGPHLLVQACADLLRTGGDERPATVVNVTSSFGSIAQAGGGGWHSYRASKAGLNMMSRVEAAELQADDVVVVAMNPGWVRTDMGGSGAHISPETSVTGMIDVLSGLGPGDTGRYLTYDGREMPW
jgi:NAD(P)-dependent dehydrogenase (short-subunit alcohol dehydrogenase family)